MKVWKVNIRILDEGRLNFSGEQVGEGEEETPSVEKND
jgi:hypothetical protein